MSFVVGFEVLTAVSMKIAVFFILTAVRTSNPTTKDIFTHLIPDPDI
jgi:hypothetical protein